MAWARELTEGERKALSGGLWRALAAAGASPVIVGRASGLARVASLWRGHLPILTLGDRIFWDGAPADCSRPGLQGQMATLQHELQHVLDYANGSLGPLRYATDPRNWGYRYDLDPARAWERYGAEQRASIAEDLWLIEHGAGPTGAPVEAYRQLIPWAK